MLFRSTSISDANALLPHPLPENNQYETVSGYVNFIFHRIPALNEKIEQNGYVITVTKRNPQHVETVHLKVNNT